MRPFLFAFLAAFSTLATAESLSSVHLPLRFEPNRGQSSSSAQYLARGAGYSVALHATGLAISARSNATVRFAGASSTARPEAKEPLPGHVNYFIGRDPSRWQRNIPTFAKVEYAGVYPGIDLVYYGQERQLEFDFRVHPGGDPSRIRMTVDRPAKVRLDRASGDLLIGEMRQHKPVAYQLNASNQRSEVDCNYVVRGNTVTLQIGGFDRQRELVIDPVLTYATYLGGTGGDAISKLKVDATGAGYAVGSTTSSNFVAPGGAQATYGGSNGQLLQAQLGDAWVGKMNAAGTLVLWASYIGGSGDDFATSVSIDAAGNAYVVGATTSANFPTTAGAAQRTYKGFLASDNNGFYNPGDGFAVKVSPSGDQLTYSTYLGGTLNDLPTGAAVASNGNLVVVGGTNSTDFPTTANAPYKQFRGAANFGPSVAGDGFISILNPGGSAFTYSTFFGGRSHDAITGVALDSLDNIFVSGLTFSGDFPVTAGAYQTTFKGLETTTDYSNAAGDAFAAKFNAQGTLAFATYLGGSFRDTATGIALGSDGSLFLTGSTSSANFPTTAAAVQKTYGGDRAYGTTGDSYYGDAFVSKLNAQGSALVYSTYLGGRGDEAGMDIAVDSASNAYVAGFTTSNEFPTSGDALQRTNAGLGGQGFAPNAAQGFPTERVRNTGDAFLTKLSADGTLAYSSFYGGNRDDGAMTVAVDAAGNAYIGGNTLSFNLALNGAIQPGLVGGGTQFPRGDAFLAKFGFGGTLPGPVSKLTIVSGFTGTGAPGAVLATPFTVEATDAQNKPVPGLTVTFSASNASVNPATAITNAFGRASTTVTLAAAGGGGVTATIAAITPVTATLTAGTGTSPTITGVNTAWGSSDIAQNTFIEIKGNNLVPADTAANGVIWSTAPEFLEGRMPTLLGGVSVTVNAKPAFVYFFCSSKTTPGCATDQINVLTPLDETVGPVQVVVTSGSGVTPAYTATKKAIVPTFLLFNPQGYVIATHANYSLLGPTTLFPGASTPATVNETIVTYAIGFGLPTAALTNGSSIQSGVFIETPVCTINSAAAATTMALISPGLYQLNIAIPAGAKNGDNSLSCSYKGSSTPSGTLITVNKP